MIGRNDQQILKELQIIFGNKIPDVFPFPEAYYPSMNPNGVKAIYLGCDPTNSDEIKFRYVFALRVTPDKFKAFVTTHTNQLAAVGLTWNDVYTQNLCRNYFKDVTSKNLQVWKAAAEGYWIESLKNELGTFDPDVPVLMTSQYIYDVLVNDTEWQKYKAPDFYHRKVDIPVPAEKNLLNRLLIPLYRGRSPKLKVSYCLHNNDLWNNYKNRIKEILLTRISII